MRVFLSYASEQRSLAEQLAQRLTSAGVEVFFDAERILPGDSFDVRIQRAVARAHAFVFLASAEALRPGSYALSELALAEKRWPNATGRILTVLLGDTQLESLPSYLKSVSVLHPQGDAIAETVAAAVRLGRRRQSAVWASALSGGLVLVVAILLSSLLPRPTGDYQIKNVTVAKSGAKLRFAAVLRNDGPEEVTTINLTPEADVPAVRFSGSTEWFQVHPGEARDSTTTFEFSNGVPREKFNWRLCWVFVKSLDLDMAKDVKPIDRFLDQRSQTVCSPYRSWQPNMGDKR